MKKNILSIAALALLFASCSEKNEGLSIPSEGDTTTKIRVSLGKFGGRSVGAPTVSGDFVAVNPDEIRVIPAQGTNAIEDKAIILPLKSLVANEYYTTASLIKESTHAFLEMNFDNGILTSNVNTRQGDVNAPVVLIDNRVEGNDKVKTEILEKGDAYELTSDLIPEMARMQIVNDLAAGQELKPNGVAAEALTIKNISIEAIYINNTKLDRAADTLARTIDAQAAWAADYAPAGDKSKLFDVATGDEWTSIIGADGMLAAGKDVAFFGPDTIVNGQTRKAALGYNVFEQALDLEGDNKSLAKQAQPHIVFEVKFAGTGVGDYTLDQEYTQYLNVVAFKAASGYTTISRGNVYEMNMSDILKFIVDPETELTDEPDPIESMVEITVKVTQWEVVPVTPELN